MFHKMRNAVRLLCKREQIRNVDESRVLTAMDDYAARTIQKWFARRMRAWREITGIETASSPTAKSFLTGWREDGAVGVTRGIQKKSPFYSH